jgi:hypothetical protein
MITPELKETMLNYLHIARDTNQPMKVRVNAAKEIARLKKLAGKPTRRETAYERHQRELKAERELDVWRREAEYRLTQAINVGRPAEAEAIRVEMRRRGIRPIGDPELAPPDRPVLDVFQYSAPKIGKPLIPGIVEWRNGSWVTWDGSGE